MRKKKGFTLIELLVVIAIIAMLLAILMPALGKVKKLAMRLVCGTNAKGLGTAMNVYAFDYNDEFPKQGGKGAAVWGGTAAANPTVNKWFNPGFKWDTAPAAVTKTINASLFMLVREADVGPKSFICPASNDVEFKMSEHADSSGMLDGSAFSINDVELTDLWDFGPASGGAWDGSEDCHNSYSYQQPYAINNGANKAYPADASGNAARAILADKSPYGDPDLVNLGANTVALTLDWKENVRQIDYDQSSSTDTVQVGNSALHDREGQNVLFNDGHAEFARRPDVSINNDNIYTRKSVNSELGRRNGKPINDMLINAWSNGSQDSVLAHDSRCSNP